MSERGVFAVDRGIWEHPIFAAEPFTEREAWQWLCGNAAWKATRARVGRAVFDLERGQLAFALRFLATKWKWSEARVRRFLKRLETDAMVIVLATREATQITICNYDKWQFGRRTDDALTDAPTEEPATRSRRKEEELNKDKKEEKNIVRSEATRTAPNEDFEKFWKAYPKRQGSADKQSARKAFEKIVKAGTSPADLIAAAGNFAAEVRSLGKENTEFVPMAATWLNKRRDLDYAAGPPIEGVMTDDEKQKLFAKLRGSNGQDSKVENLRGAGAGPYQIEGSWRQEPAAGTDDQTKHSAMGGVAQIFPRMRGM